MTVKRRIPIGPAQIDVLLTLYEMEPATVLLIETAIGQRSNTVPAMLTCLLKHKLVSRQKADPGPELTKEERRGLLPTHLRIGKRPYVYSLTKRGRNVACGLNLASEAFRQHSVAQVDSEERHASA